MHGKCTEVDGASERQDVRIQPRRNDGKARRELMLGHLVGNKSHAKSRGGKKHIAVMDNGISTGRIKDVFEGRLLEGRSWSSGGVSSGSPRRDSDSFVCGAAVGHY